MNNDSPIKALVVVLATALICSILVTVTVITLKPIQLAYENRDRNRYVVEVSGLTGDAGALSEQEVMAHFQSLEARIVDLERARFDQRYNPATFDTWQVDPAGEFGIAISAADDLARLSRRSRLATVYLVNENDALKRLILPIYGKGMWSMLYGFIALEADLNTIGGITFFKQAETPGIGDRILRPDWRSRWQGKRLYDDSGGFRFHIGAATGDSGALQEQYQVDGLTGATITVDAVADTVRYWFGPNGYAPFLDSMRQGATP